MNQQGPWPNQNFNPYHPNAYGQPLSSPVAAWPTEQDFTQSYVQPQQPQRSLHHRQHSNAGLNYLDLTAQARAGQHTGLDGGIPLATQFAAVLSNQSPISPLHTLPSQPNLEGSDEEYDEEGGIDDYSGVAEQPRIPMTAAESIAHKRRMKRFRLTHEQTRFLINEFIRQPHPDAAHRERLSAEIPGLSPRQVQVWFQNRRAKMKRLSPEDRERMLKSRSLPDDIEKVKALRSNSVPESAAEPWMADNPGTSIPTMNDLKHLFLQGVDAIAAVDNASGQQKMQSVLSQSAYPSPPAAGDRSLPMYDCRLSATVPNIARSTTSEEEEHPDAAYIRNMLQQRGHQPVQREANLIFGREIPYLPPHDSDLGFQQ